MKTLFTLLATTAVAAATTLGARSQEPAPPAPPPAPELALLPTILASQAHPAPLVHVVQAPPEGVPILASIPTIGDLFSAPPAQEDARIQELARLKQRLAELESELARRTEERAPRDRVERFRLHAPQETREVALRALEEAARARDRAEAARDRAEQYRRDVEVSRDFSQQREDEVRARAMDLRARAEALRAMEEQMKVEQDMLAARTEDATWRVRRVRPEVQEVEVEVEAGRMDEETRRHVLELERELHARQQDLDALVSRRLDLGSDGSVDRTALRALRRMDDARAETPEGLALRFHAAAAGEGADDEDAEEQIEWAVIAEGGEYRDRLGTYAFSHEDDDDGDEEEIEWAVAVGNGRYVRYLDLNAFGHEEEIEEEHPRYSVGFTTTAPGGAGAIHGGPIHINVNGGDVHVHNGGAAAGVTLHSDPRCAPTRTGLGTGNVFFSRTLPQGIGGPLPPPGAGLWVTSWGGESGPPPTLLDITNGEDDEDGAEYFEVIEIDEELEEVEEEPGVTLFDPRSNTILEAAELTLTPGSYALTGGAHVTSFGLERAGLAGSPGADADLFADDERLEQLLRLVEEIRADVRALRGEVSGLRREVAGAPARGRGSLPGDVIGIGGGFGGRVDPAAAPAAPTGSIGIGGGAGGRSGAAPAPRGSIGIGGGSGRRGRGSAPRSER